jgi:uncharacterized membrane protein YhaH (DUF805 family)
VFFVPLLILNLAAISGHFILPEGFSWIGSTIVTALLAIFIPIVCLVLIILFFMFVVRKAGKLLFGKNQKND